MRTLRVNLPMARVENECQQFTEEFIVNTGEMNHKPISSLLTDASAQTGKEFGSFLINRWRLFVLPLFLHPFSMIASIALITVGVFVWESQFDRISGENAIGAMVLASEAISESGPDVRAAGAQHIELGGYFLEASDPHCAATIAGYLDSGISRNRHVCPAITKMATQFAKLNKSDELLTNAIHQFAHELREYGEESYKNATVLGRPGWKNRTRHLSAKEEAEIEESIVELDKAVSDLTSAMTFATAEQLCKKSRTAAAKLYLSWDDYTKARRREETLDLFRSRIDHAILLIPQVAGNPQELEKMGSYVESLKRRRLLLDRFQEGDFQKLYDALVASYNLAKKK